MKNPSIDRKRFLLLCILYFCCALFILLFSYSTSLLYPYYYGNDSAHFMTMAAAWRHGMIPYKDLFEHKGPFIYFVDFLGFCLCGSKTGISLLQFVFLCITITAVFEICRLISNNHLWSFLCSFLTLIALKANYQEGNSVEEYCLPFICWSVYGFVQWYKGKRSFHPVRWAFLYGCTFGICLLTRATNAVPLFGGLLVICLHLSTQKQFKNLLQNLLFGFLGFLCTVLPFVIYFSIHHALHDMLFDSLLFNYFYSKGCDSWINTATSNSLTNHLQNYFTYRIIFFLIPLGLIRKDRLSALAYTATAVFESVLYLSNNDFIQYPLVCLPQFTLLLNEIYHLINSKRTEHRYLSHLLLFRCGIFLYFIVSGNMILAADAWNGGHTHIERDWEMIMDLIPPEEKNSFAAWSRGINLKEIYLLEDITPCYKYYITQTWLADFSEQIKNDIVKTYSTADAKWILTDDIEDTALILPILEENYELYAVWENYQLFRLKSE